MCVFSLFYWFDHDHICNTTQIKKIQHSKNHKNVEILIKNYGKIYLDVTQYEKGIISLQICSSNATLKHKSYQQFIVDV